MLVQYVSLGLLAITALITVFNLVKGLIRGLKKTIGTLIAIVLSAIVAAIVTSIVCSPSSDTMIMLMDEMKSSFVDDAAEANALIDAITYYGIMIIKPFFFMVAYSVLSVIFSIIIAIVIKFIPILNVEGLAKRLGGLGVGALCGIIVSFILLMPVVGVMDVAIEVGQVMESMESDDDLENTDEDAQEGDDIGAVLEELDIDSLADDPTFKVYDACCGWMFNSLASVDYEGEKVYLKNDIAVMASAIAAIQDLSVEMSQYGDYQIECLNKMIDALETSPLLRGVVAQIFAEASGEWLEGDQYLGVSFDSGELLQPLMNKMFEVFATSNKDTITADLRTMTEMFGVLINYDILENADDYDAVLGILGDGAISEMIITVNKNSRMSPISDEITKLSIRAVASTIGMPEDAEERYDLLMNEISEVLNSSYGMSSDERVDFVNAGVTQALKDYGVAVNGEAADNIARSIIADLGSQYDLTGDDVSEFFMIYAIAATDEGLYTSDGQRVDSMSSSSGVVIEGNSVIINGIELENYTAWDYMNSSAYNMGKSGADFAGAATLFSKDTMESCLVTLEDIYVTIGSFDDCEDVELEAEKISDMVHTVMDIFSSGNFDGLTQAEIIDKLGALLDEMDETEIFGHETTSKLLTAVLQSEKMLNTLHLSVEEVTEVANKMNNAVVSDGSSYQQVSSSVATTIDMISSVNDDTKTAEEKQQTTEKLLNDMTPANAELLSTMVKPSMMEGYGVSQEKSGTVSASISSMFENMANYTAPEDDPEAYKREADAVNKVLTLAMDGTKDAQEGSTLFSNESGNGRMDTTAKDFVDLIANSEVVSGTLNQTVYDNGHDDNPLGVGELTDSDAEELMSAINDYYDENKTDNEEENAELQKKLNAIAIVTNLEIPFQ